MNIILPNNFVESTEKEMPNWIKINNLIPKSNITEEILLLSQTHLALKYKIAFADYHLHLLDQLYKPNTTERQSDTENWVRAELYAIITTLYSVLDTLFFEINLSYAFGLSVNQIHTHHNHTKPDSNCIRCLIDQKNNNLTCYINTTFVQKWFEVFRELRNQITHKNLPVLQFVLRPTQEPSTTKITLPNNPTNNNPKVEDYSDNLEISQYCKERRNDIIRVVEKTIELIESELRLTYKF
jgi:hypothetical protein